MTLEDFAKLLESTGYPVAFFEFPEEEPHDPPFLCYITTASSNFAADGVVYYSGNDVQVELYTTKKDVEAESVVENALASFYFLKDEGYLSDEKMYMVTYQLSL